MSDELRDRLHELAEEATPELSDRARRRVVDAVRLEGPALVHGGASRRRAIIFGGAVALAAAAALAFVVAGPGASDDGVADMSAPACQAWDPAAQASDAARYDLGARGLVAVDGTASLSATDPCLTTVHLSDGRVDVRADDLGGGVLRVDAGPVAVEVRGTRFAVTRHGDDITVAVTEGHVVVTAPEEREIDLRDGERWSLGQELAMLGPQREGNGNGNGSGSGSGSGNGDGNGNGNASGNGDANGNGNGDGSGDGSGNGGGNGNGNANGNANGNGSGNADGNGDGNGNGNGNASGSGNGNASGSGNGNASGHVDPSALLSRAEALWRDEQRGAARRVFRQVGQGDSTLAEASWVRLARLELRAGNTRGALSALRTRSRRFSEGRLGAESLWLEADAYRRLGDDTSRRRVISELQRRHPDSPQARAAARQIE